MHWTTKDGRKINIKDMSDDHLRNAVAMLRRQGFVGADEYALAIGSAFSMSGEMAQYYAEQSVADMMPSQCLDAMECEIAMRANVQSDRRSAATDAPDGEEG